MVKGGGGLASQEGEMTTIPQWETLLILLLLIFNEHGPPPSPQITKTVQTHQKMHTLHPLGVIDSFPKY